MAIIIIVIPIIIAVVTSPLWITTIVENKKSKKLLSGWNGFEENTKSVYDDINLQNHIYSHGSRELVEYVMDNLLRIFTSERKSRCESEWYSLVEREVFCKYKDLFTALILSKNGIVQRQDLCGFSIGPFYEESKAITSLKFLREIERNLTENGIDGKLYIYPIYVKRNKLGDATRALIPCSLVGCGAVRFVFKYEILGITSEKNLIEYRMW